ncbi:helicase [Arthrobacter alpinus]|uniref:Helicase n=1 Tax=Arthrobacter alpinus TaxID=656366 RepID=A0A0S2M3D0_9MICC|nr:DEAD/DEAH box helicase [Arthrobacter alpinus]ALO67927.1 helicase [Arthrobacter alpinus]
MNTFDGENAPAQLEEGLYELLHTQDLTARLRAVPELEATSSRIDEASSPQALSRHVAETVKRLLANTVAEDRVAKVNQLLAIIDPDNEVTAGPTQLRSLHRPDVLKRRQLRRPTTSLSDSALLTNGKDDPNLAAEIRAEIESADTVDLLCAFIRWTGIRLLEPALDALKARGGRFRVITTTYMGATERRAIDELVKRYGAEVKISYETQSTRLHAKAWLFHRNTGFSTAYVGSSNLSGAAMLDGLEWNVRLSNIGTPALLQKFAITFDSYWEQRAFQPYDPATDAEKLDAALLRNGDTRTSAPSGYTGLEVEPYLHQVEMLEDLEAERNKGFHRNLLVAATGTGKTVIAALDFRRLCEASGRKLTLLFVAHRKEILQQSLTTYRNVMQSGSFGELFVGDHKPQEWKHVFASVQSLTAKNLDNFDPSKFDVVVIDEFHHSAAKTYRKLIDHLTPQEFLGLTATPERGDGIHVADEFFEGRTASELRLWDALDADLLVPFHYFGVSDGVDLSSLDWKRGSYDLQQLSEVYTGNDVRAGKIIKELQDKVTSSEHMRAIGFCVSIQHAEYMARVFNAAGIKSVAVSGQTDDGERALALSRLQKREINCIFAVDLFNEGLDLPQVDTILLLRPTQSATIFMQQLGRGLRRAKGKAVLTVMDFIGQQHREFRFDVRFRAMTGYGRKQLEKAVDQDFPFLPSGSQIVLDRVAKDVVLENLKAQLKLNKPKLTADIKSYGELYLAGYLAKSGHDIKTIYKSTKNSWTEYLRLAGLIDWMSPAEAAVAGKLYEVASAEEKKLLTRMASLIHVDDRERADAYSMIVGTDAPAYADLSPREQTFARMLFFTLWDNGGGFESYEEGFDNLRRYPFVCSEIAQVVALGAATSKRTGKTLGGALTWSPLQSHLTYGRYEVLAALGAKSLDTDQQRKIISMGGVAWCEPSRTDAFFVTLSKDAVNHSATTMYKDYALSPELFHWESQNATSPESPTGRRYLDSKGHDSQVLIFSRDKADDETGLTAPYTCLGQVDYVRHKGGKPIAITWKLHRPMPADVYADAAAVAQ